VKYCLCEEFLTILALVFKLFLHAFILLPQLSALAFVELPLLPQIVFFLEIAFDGLISSNEHSKEPARVLAVI
jgi:hypothetical protein